MRVASLVNTDLGNAELQFSDLSYCDFSSANLVLAELINECNFIMIFAVYCYNKYLKSINMQ